MKKDLVVTYGVRGRDTVPPQSGGDDCSGPEAGGRLEQTGRPKTTPSTRTSGTRTMRRFGVTSYEGSHLMTIKSHAYLDILNSLIQEQEHFY